MASYEVDGPSRIEQAPGSSTPQDAGASENDCPSSGILHRSDTPNFELRDVGVSLRHRNIPEVTSPKVARIGGRKSGGACLLRPGVSDVDLFRYCQGVIYFDAQISDGAFDLRVPEQKLDRPE